MTKPMLATDYDKKKIRFPAYIQPKVDGVRALNLDGSLTGRSLKKHRNKFTTSLFSNNAFMGLDGEMAAGPMTDEALCRNTTSALGTIKGEPYVLWHLFDYVTPITIHLPYRERYEHLRTRVAMLQQGDPVNWPGIERIRLMPSYLVRTIEEVEEADAYYCAQGYEGTIIRFADGRYKEGRSTTTEGGLLRIKHFVEEDAVVIALVEGKTNNNEAMTNALGYTERSTHSENMVLNGMVGALDCVDVKTRLPIRVAAGAMSHEDRKHYFENPHLILQKHIKYKKFLKGEKDKPRFPTFQSIRLESDTV